ncbi:hypothetical protein HER32_06775 [Hymenobacter sp. BT18]|uniref:hypothetical protein n=1 Tax=Hymenobacter sp. BT18 TaxID=2835648 RepID=UPI00143ECD52|nr:hypothetical protein [Hymenobacter sp. BT18]QIX60897.1 hypothetical protein HER32_06775 [Hymenobacter sp. BT18]
MDIKELNEMEAKARSIAIHQFLDFTDVADLADCVPALLEIIDNQRASLKAGAATANDK